MTKTALLLLALVPALSFAGISKDAENFVQRLAGDYVIDYAQDLPILDGNGRELRFQKTAGFYDKAAFSLVWTPTGLAHIDRGNDSQYYLRFSNGDYYGFEERKSVREKKLTHAFLPFLAYKDVIVRKVSENELLYQHTLESREEPGAPWSVSYRRVLRIVDNCDRTINMTYLNLDSSIAALFIKATKRNKTLR